MYDVYLGLGSNLGDRLEYLRHAVHEIEKIAIVVQASSVYEAEPVEMSSPNQFLNMALHIRTDCWPAQLLHKLTYIEKKLGRAPSTHLKDREIDIDILIYDGLYYEDHELHVPHSSFEKRRFALVPLNELAPMVQHPLTGGTITTLLVQCKDKGKVQKINDSIAILNQQH